MSNGSSSPNPANGSSGDSLWDYASGGQGDDVRSSTSSPASHQAGGQTPAPHATLVLPAIGGGVSPSPTPVPPAPGVRPRISKRMLVLMVIIVLGALGSLQLGLFVGAGGVSRLHPGGGHSTPAARGTPTAQATPSPASSPSPVGVGNGQTPGPGGGQTPVVTNTPTGPGPSQFAAQDTFARPDQAHWGLSSDGQTWGGDANTLAAFAIAGGAGTITGGQGFLTALLGPQLGDTEVQFTGSLSHFNNLLTNVGAVLRWTDANNYYKAYIDGNELVLIKRVAGSVTRLAALPFDAHDGTAYTLRFRAVGATLSAKVWATGSPEPAGWMLTVTDHSLPSGFGGLRVLLQPGVVARVSAFEERSLP